MGDCLRSLGKIALKECSQTVVLEARRLQNNVFYDGLEAPKPCFLGLEAEILGSKIAPRSPPGGLRRGTGGPGGRQEAPNWRQSRFLSDFGCHFGIPKSFKFELELLKNGAPPWIDNFSYMEASGGGFGLDFGLVWGSILASRAP